MRLQLKNLWDDHVPSTPQSRPSPRAPAPLAAATVPPTAEWDEAFLRVESYLRAHRIESRVQLNQLATGIINRARVLAAEHPDQAPVTLAMQVTRARIGEWLVHAIGQGDWADERFRARGRLALLLADIPRRCPERFLSHAELPAQTQARLSDAQLQPGPEVRLTRMPSTSLEFPITDMVEQKWETFSRSIFVRAATSWLLLVGFLGAAWYATH